MFFKRKKNNDFLSIKIEKLIDWNEPNGGKDALYLTE